ncbi:BREX-1 system adenine-specific DNA-methyltransferase PglX [Flavobacterium lindanitolerans]|uniref:BREX-1 system adenine-specific DNA-methyltransferase PglX n=1 Tax=Flavobacterium lindanitolerans TaxID=428988 RepID=UPI0031D92F7E
MNTSKLKKFAQEARTKLMTLVAGKLEAVQKQDTAALRDKAVTIQKLNEKITEIGKEALIDKVAYTWFNRLVALRFMDVNDFQPLGISILSPANGAATQSSQILGDIHAGIFPDDLSLDRPYINAILNGTIASANADNTIFRYILIAVCNDLHRVFPFLFEKIDDYSELLLPDDLTSPFSIIADIVNGMSAEDCREVEIIGWLYQFYVSEKKDEVFASKSKVKKEDIPAATQLFTPRWIVEYMVQNTVGKLWLQNHPESGLKQYMPYYIEPTEGNTDNYLKISSAEEIKLLDQACGSGHILVYGFELLAKIYEEQGYSNAEIPAKIIENNLHGLEIDERAAQLAAFAITMKARQYYRRFYRNPAVPHIICYEDTKFNADEINQIITEYNISEKEAFKYDLKLLEQATNLGSLIQPKTSGYVLTTLKNILDDEGESNDLFWQQTQNKLRLAVRQLLALSEKYHCVVDNPPYMGGGNMNTALGDFVKTNYPKSKADLMACFMEAGIAALYPKGLLGMINQHSWMFLSSYETLRKHLIDNIHFDTLLHLGPRTFPEIGGEVVQNAAFTFSNQESKAKGTYIRLVDFDSSELKKEKTLEAIQNPDCGYLFNIDQKNFVKIEGIPISFWIEKYQLKIFEGNKVLKIYAKPAKGMMPGSNFIRFSWEVESENIAFGIKSHKESMLSPKKWYPYFKGGEYRKWFGNREYVVLFYNDGSILKKNNYGERNPNFYFLNQLNWTKVSGTKFSVRSGVVGGLYDDAACQCPVNDEQNFYFLLAYLNTKISNNLLGLISNTLNFSPGEIGKIPILFNRKIKGLVDNISLNCENLSKQEWNSRETSWDFLQNELVRFGGGGSLKSAITSYKEYWAMQFHTLHQNEEELNRQFIDIYGLQEELTPDVPLEDITILKEESGIVDGQLVFNEQELIAQLLSYAVGCIFGRYSLDKEGLILANQGETFRDYLQKVDKSQDELRFVPDEDNVIPLLEEEWFDDDIVSRVKELIRSVWGDASYAENIQHIEEILGKDLRKYLTKDFYKDHIKRYKKRPIYWQFSSPKGHFNVIVYMHRYTPDTLNFILNSYLRPFMEKVANDLKRQEDIIIAGSAVEQGKARKRQDKLKEILKDCEAYEYDILYPLAGERITIDLDDGVLVNYNKFGNAIAPVAGLNDAKTKKKVAGFDWIDARTIK